MYKLVLFTDLDGTLLDDMYRFEAALPALVFIAQQDIPLVICSSKTRTEIELYRKRLRNNHPFVSENGGGIFIPSGYFGRNVVAGTNGPNTGAEYEIVRLGAQYTELREAIKAFRDEGHLIRGFGDMAAEEITRITGLTIEEAAMAKERDFDEPFIFDNGDERLETLIESARKKGLSVTQGRIHHLLGQSDKGKAVSQLIDLYRRHYGTVVTVGLGDSPNDLPMLTTVDIPVVVQKRDGTYDPLLLPRAIKARGIGPTGWSSAVTELIKKVLRR